MKNDHEYDYRSAAVGGGMSLGTVLTIVFIVLKLCTVISWNWFWVLCPIIFEAAAVIAIVLIMVIVYLVVAIISSKE